jgi:YD repeat-containing protein
MKFKKITSGSEILCELLFDETNRLQTFKDKEGQITKYTYDGLGRRVKVNSTDYLCDITKPYNSVLQTGDRQYILWCRNIAY